MFPGMSDRNFGTVQGHWWHPKPVTISKEEDLKRGVFDKFIWLELSTSGGRFLFRARMFHICASNNNRSYQEQEPITIFGVRKDNEKKYAAYVALENNEMTGDYAEQFVFSEIISNMRENDAFQKWFRKDFEDVYQWYKRNLFENKEYEQTGLITPSTVVG